VTILLVGAGKMGSHFYDHWQRDDVVMDPPLNLNPTPQLVDAIVVAVKPQTAPEAFPAVVPFIGPDTVVVSIMAGRTLAYLRSALPPVAIVRAMPSMAGISVAIANRRVTDAQCALAQAADAHGGRGRARQRAIAATSGAPAPVWRVAASGRGPRSWTTACWPLAASVAFYSLIALFPAIAAGVSSYASVLRQRQSVDLGTPATRAARLIEAPSARAVRILAFFSGVQVVQFAMAFVAEEQHSPERRPSGARRNASRYLKVGTVKGAGVSNRNRSTTTAL
jgi:hypothetical protein